MIDVRRAADRYVTEHDGITSRHCFAAGPHYDPANLSFGPLLAVDEHLVAPGAGFAEHAHRGVVIVSWVLAGTLRHESAGQRRDVGPGEVFVQDATAAIRHVERNASASEPLRFVQTTWQAGSGARLTVQRGCATVDGPAHLYVARGSFAVDGAALEEGDSARTDEAVGVSGGGELLVVHLALSGGEC